MLETVHLAGEHHCISCEEFLDGFLINPLLKCLNELVDELICVVALSAILPVVVSYTVDTFAARVVIQKG